MDTQHSRAATKLREIFEKDLTVSHIAEFELELADPSMSADKLLQRMEEADFDVMPLQGDRPDKYVDRQDLKGEEQVAAVARSIEISDLVSESTSILQILRLLANRDWYFVLRNDSVSGIVTQADLHKTPVQMFLFGIILLFESKLVRLIEHYLRGDGWMECLTEDRLRKAQELLDLKKVSNDALGLIDCLMLCDKGSIVEKTAELLTALSLSRQQAKKVFDRVERLRNALAHGEDFLQGQSWPEIMALVDRMETTLSVYDGRILVDFASVPSEPAIAVAQNPETDALAEVVSNALDLGDTIDRQFLRDELVGVVAEFIDTYLKR